MSTNNEKPNKNLNEQNTLNHQENLGQQGNLNKQESLNKQENLNHQNSNFNIPPKKSPWGDIFLGSGLSILLILSMFATLYIGKVGITSMVILALISASTFLAVRFIRRKRPIAGKILLGAVVPLTLILLIFGACFVSLGVL